MEIFGENIVVLVLFPFISYQKNQYISGWGVFSNNYRKEREIMTCLPLLHYTSLNKEINEQEH